MILVNAGTLPKNIGAHDSTNGIVIEITVERLLTDTNIAKNSINKLPIYPPASESR